MKLTYLCVTILIVLFC